MLGAISLERVYTSQEYHNTVYPSFDAEFECCLELLDHFDNSGSFSAMDTPKWPGITQRYVLQICQIKELSIIIIPCLTPEAFSEKGLHRMKRSQSLDLGVHDQSMLLIYAKKGAEIFFLSCSSCIHLMRTGFE